MNPAFVYFDLDDTLLDHKKAEEAALRDVHTHFELFDGTKPESLINVYHRINKHLWERYGLGAIDRHQLQHLRFADTLRELDLDGQQTDDIGRFYMQCYRNHWRWIDGAQDAIDRIAGEYETGIITNGFSEVQEAKFEHFALRDIARHLIISEDVGVMKPNPGIFEYATEIAGCGKDEILYVGDSYNSDIAGGSGFGWHTAWYTHDTNGYPVDQADLVFSNFETLCRALEV